MAGWHHQLNALEFGWILGVGYGQGGLVCCDSWSCRESDMTEQLNWTELNQSFWLWFAFLYGCYVFCGLWVFILFSGMSISLEILIITAFNLFEKTVSFVVVVVHGLRHSILDNSWIMCSLSLWNLPLLVRFGGGGFIAKFCPILVIP